jgi:peroxiredoxin Q/BCP
MLRWFVDIFVDLSLTCRSIPPLYYGVTPVKKLLSCLAVALSFVFAGAKVHAADLKVGDMAPDFEMQGSDGKPHALKDYRDKQAVVLAWFPKAFTGGCTKECQSFQADSADIKKFDVAYFTASVDSVADDTDFAKKLGVTDYAILADPTRAAATAYGVVDSGKGFARRWTFYIGKDGKILAIDKGVNVQTHGKDVAAKLAELKVDLK